MNTVTTQLQLLNQFKGEANSGQSIHFEHIDLTPPLVLASALMYMMASDGEIKDSESSQLQSVLGGHDELVACAASYVQSVPLEKFLMEAADSLSGLDKLCILTNICDSFLADGQADTDELSLFSRMCASFGFDEAAFEPYLKTIQLKNDKSALGRYNLTSAMDPQGAISNHLALAVCIVYMMASDGHIGPEEIGRLQAAIGEFDGLQSVALKYVLKVKNVQFLREVAPRLSADVKLLILTNVCDTLLSDGVVEPAEKRLFASMLTAFGYSEKSFRSYYETLHIKNVKPFDLNDFADSAAAQVFRSARYQVNQAAFNAAHSGEGDAIGIVIHRTMEDNITSVSHNAGGNDNVHVMTNNANNLQNIQKVSVGQRKDNIQFVHGSEHASDNIQYVDSQSHFSANIQRLDATGGMETSSQLQLGEGMGVQGKSDDESLKGKTTSLGSGANSDISIDDRAGKGGLTNMAQAKVSYRDRAMQNSQPLTHLSAGDGAMDAANLLSRLQALKQRNAEVASKLQQLHAGVLENSIFEASVSPQPGSTLTKAKVRPQTSNSALQRMQQKVQKYFDPTGDAATAG